LQAGTINGTVNTEFHHHAPAGKFVMDPGLPALIAAPP
jgi:hypothetical protein